MRLYRQIKMYDIFQVQLLREGKDIPPDLQEQIQAGKEATQSESEQLAALQAELNSHKEKV